MISMPLFKRELKSIWKIFIIFLAVLTMYTTVILSMFDPDLGNILADFEKAMPGIMAAVGMKGAGATSLVGYAASYLFGFIMIVFPMIFSIILSNKLVAKYVDNGSMAYLLATPNTRRKIVCTQAIFSILCTALLITLVTIIGITYSEYAFPDELNIQKYILLSVGAFGLQIAIGGFGFLVSCISNETRISYSFSIGLPIACYIIQMVANQGDKFENLKYATFFTLFSPDKIVAGDNEALWMLGGLYIAGVIMYIIGCKCFEKRNLPI
ncbi:ABC transporter permease [Clostridioides mangenotii]|uniref:ABC transporter permease n=1 Tax=Metaclostridioides mangenotii TaxID=1540 RepID=UPI00214A872A|nr:ABC transporter permease [Clostridioides mangenotii]MCR1955762.1 ABC transporter permease [Clostridioides mangenotii]